MSDNLKTFLANLNKAVWDNESVTVGGGEFSPNELAEVIKEIKQRFENKGTI